MMVLQHGIKLAACLVSENWGKQNSKVFECLLCRGTLTLPQIVRFTGLSRENVRQSLLVLIHQNCVQAFAIEREGGFGEQSKIITEYMALFDNALHIMRFPRFIKLVSEELGKECEEIFEDLILHGRLSLSKIIKSHKQTSGQGDCSLKAVRGSFRKLVNARFVERCPAPEPFLQSTSEDETPAKKRGAKTNKVREVPETIEQRALAAAAPIESLRFLIERDSSSDISEKTSQEQLSDARVGEKRKQGAIESDGGPSGNHEKKEVLWRVNFEELMHRLRHKACIANVRSRLNGEADIIFSAALELSRKSETKVKTERTASLSLYGTLYEVTKKEGGLCMNLERIRCFLVQLGCELPMEPSEETCYSVDLKNIIEMAQNEQVESIVLKRYGRKAYMIFRLLTKKGCLLETDEIANATFVEKQNAIKILHKLWEDDYLQMEKVTINGARQTQISLWKVDKECLREHVLDEMYHTALNLRLRIKHEKEQAKEILKLPREEFVDEPCEKSNRVRDVLGSLFMNLDDSLMLFHDF